MATRRALVLLALSIAAAQPAIADPAPTPPATARAHQLDGWWARQAEKEAADRFWNGPREQRRALTRDQFEQWERQRDRRLGRPHHPF